MNLTPSNSNVLIHPVVTQHPGRIAALEQRTGLRAITLIGERPKLVSQRYMASDNGPRVA